MPEQYYYIIKKGFGIFKGGFRHNIASIVTLATLIFMYLAVYTVNHSVSSAVGSVSDSRAVRVFITDEADKDEIAKSIKSLKLKADVDFFDKADAKSRVLAMTPDDEHLAELDEDLFPRFYEIKTEAANDKAIAKAAKKLEEVEGVSSVESGKKQNEKLQKIKNISSMFVALITLLTGVSCCFIVFNTTRLSLYKHHRAIMLYTLVGATRYFITMPYVAAIKMETTLSFFIALIMNKIFAGYVASSILSDSLFVLQTPSMGMYIFLYLILMTIAALSAIFSVVTFLMQQKSINEV